MLLEFIGATRARRARSTGPTSARTSRCVAAACSTLERNAEAAERELLEWKKIAFMRDRVGEAFDGIVTGIAAFGCFVRLTESLVEGLLRVDRLGPAWFDFDEGRMELHARAGGPSYTLGDRLRVRVDRVDAALRRVELSLEETPAGGQRRSERPARGGRGRKADRRGISKPPSGPKLLCRLVGFLK